MSEKTIGISSVLDLADDKYYELSDAEKRALVEEFSSALKSQIPEGLSLRDPARKPKPLTLLIGAPKQIDVTEKKQFPVFVAYSRTTLRKWQVTPKFNFFLFAKHHNTGKVHILTLPIPKHRVAKPPASGKGEPPRKVSDSATNYDVYKLSLLDLNKGVLTNGYWSLFAIEHDVMSNRVDISIANSSDAGPASISQREYLTYFQLREPFAEDRVKVMPTKNHDVVMRVALKIDPRAERKAAEDGNVFVAINFLILPIDERARAFKVDVPINEFTVDGQTVYNTAFEVDLSQATKHQITNPRTKVYIEDGMGLIGPIDVSFQKPE